MAKLPAEELLKRHNCRYIEVGGSKFILVGGTHAGVPTQILAILTNRQELTKGLANYTQVKDFFDSFDYDAICMECGITTGKIPVWYASDFFKRMVETLKADAEVWAEINRIFNQISLRYPKFIKLLTGEDELSRGDLEYCRWVLENFPWKFELSEKGRNSLSKAIADFAKSRWDYLTAVYLREVYSPDKISFKGLESILLLKAVKAKKDFVLCDRLAY